MKRPIFYFLYSFLFTILLFSTSTVKSQNVKQWTVTGPNEPALSKLDDFMKAYMQQNDLKGGALAVAKDGRIVYAKGYTYAEQGYPITQPTSLFRIASLSKPVTSLEIHRLIAAKKLTLDTLIQDILKFPLPTQNAQPANLQTPGQYFNAIKLRHLLGHRGGWDRDANTFNDPTFYHDQDVAKSLNGSVPVSKLQLAKWGATQPQQLYPGAQYHYSNYGYLLLGMLIEKATGKTYINAVKSNLLTPLGIERPQQAMTKESQKRKGEVSYHVSPAQTVNCAISTGTCPTQYGGENILNFDSFGGWLFSPVDYVKLMSSFRTKKKPMPDLPPGNLITLQATSGLSKSTVFDHGGMLPGTWSYMAYRMDGVDFMVVWNTTNNNTSFKYDGTTYNIGAHPTIWHKILNEVTTWPAYDLAPAYFGKTASTSMTEKILYDGIWNSAPQNVIMERAKTPAEFQALYSKYYSNYKLSSQQTYMANGIMVRDGIWVFSKGEQFVTWDRTPADFQQLYDEWWKKGYRLVHQEAHIKNGQLVYNGIWNPSTAGQFVTWDKTLAQFNALNADMIKKGFHLDKQQACIINGQKRYNGIWNPGNANHFTAHEKTRDQFAQIFNQQFGKNYRLINMQAYYHNGQLFYDGIWAPGTYGQYISWGKNNEWIDAENIIQKTAKFQPFQLSAY